MDTPVYLLYLLARFQALGGTVIRGSVQHVSQAAEGWARILLGKVKKFKPFVILT
jgi:D-amino-acid oxidase